MIAGTGTSVPATTALSERISKELKRARLSKFVGPTITYALRMQAVGIVNDHSLACFRREAVGGQPE